MSTDSDCMPSDVPQLHLEDTRERDACALICAVRKGGEPTHGNVKRTIEALTRMGHRTGIVEGEGDGVGIMTDIPRRLWTKAMAHKGLRSSLASDANFWVAHLMLPARERENTSELVEVICRRISEAGLELLIDRPGETNPIVLGQNARKNEPVFWQFAGMNGRVPSAILERTLYQLQTTLEREMGIHFPSFSSRSVVYKVQGTVEILRRYYPELRDPEYASTITLGHARYSTNTNPIFERVQPFNVLGHNGEFNTISRFRLEGAMLGIELDPGNSDSQDVDRLIDGLCMQYDLDLIEAMEYIFPPFQHDLIENAAEIHDMYANIRRAYGPFAQGPAAVVARVGDHCVFSVDALGLRPLWFGETEKEFFATSERGVYPLDAMSADPKPLSPGEKIAVIAKRGQPIEVLEYPAIQRYVHNKYRDRVMFGRMGDKRGTGTLPAVNFNSLTQPMPSNGGNGYGNGHGNGHGNGNGSSLPYGNPQPTPSVMVTEAFGAMGGQPAVAPARVAIPAAAGYTAASAAPATWTTPINTTTMAALGWERYHLSVIEALSESAKELVGSLGWDGPLAAMSHTRVNLADYFKETVAVVTNPAIDRERELAQFSTAVLLGARPTVGTLDNGGDLLVQLEIPLLVGGHPALGSAEAMQAVAKKYGTMTLEEAIDLFGDRMVRLSTSAAVDESIEDALARLGQAAVNAVQNGALCILLDDADSLNGAQLWLDPLMVVATVDRALRNVGKDSENLRRRAGIILRSGALRDLHDVMMCISFGASALVPYAMYGVALGIAPKAPKQAIDDAKTVELLSNMVKALVSGMQKVTSTIGCHELRGYGHSFSSVGFADEVAAIFDTPNYFGSAQNGTTFADLRASIEARAVELRGEKPGKLDNPDRLYPKMWKKVEDIALGEMTLDEYTDAMLKLETEMPVSPRHLLGLRTTDEYIDPATVDISVGSWQHTHDMPALIGAMSFGSQGKLAYSAYAEAAHRLNILCVNGEGGELPDVMGKYPRHRGNQIASARFGVNIGFLNSCDILEIKIGQGAKPGEGGQLPGYKVTEEVALARSTSPWVDLISPSNNHDLYSIEDLAQLIDELKTANPNARVSVKVPVVPGVGIIAVGIAKAGADIINITGYEGGTGAARAHSLRHVGLPAEIGLWLAHRALIESGLRDDVELWADGGMKSGRDVIKMMCLGANRVGFGTMAMVAVGCTICRKCHEGTCHVGITTHIRTIEEALEKGIKHFEPREYENAVQGIVNVFNMLAEDIRRWTAKMGFTRTQDLVGRADLLEQIAMHDKIDLTPLTMRVPRREKKPLQRGIGVRLARPRNTLSKQITSVISEHAGWGELEMTYDDEQVMAMDRALGTHLSGALKRGDVPNTDKLIGVHLNFSNSAIPGNGLAAFIDAPVDVLVEGGAQDGVGKCARGGAITILKGLNHNGQRLDGSVGKSFAYGAQGGRFIVQGYADTRACIRLSGADVIFGAEVERPLQDELGGLAARSHLKGYACEYMTSGRVLVLGDPGPWMCAGMSGGAVYQRIQPEMNLTVEAIRRRIAKGAMVDILPMDEQGILDVQDLLGYYIYTLEQNNQGDQISHLYGLLARPQDHFVKIARPNRKN